MGHFKCFIFLPTLLTKKNRLNLNTVAQGKIFPTFKETLQMLLTFGLTVLAWIFFRAENINHAINIVKKIFSPSLFSLPNDFGGIPAIKTIILILIFLIKEWIGKENQYALSNWGLIKHRYLRYILYYGVVLAIITFGGKEQQFIYFQF